jgi:hypothetical protein
MHVIILLPWLSFSVKVTLPPTARPDAVERLALLNMHRPAASCPDALGHLRPDGAISAAPLPRLDAEAARRQRRKRQLVLGIQERLERLKIYQAKHEHPAARRKTL